MLITQSLILLLSVAAAAVRTWSTRNNWLRAYFICQIVAWFGLELPQLLKVTTKGDWRYAFLFVVVTFAILAAGAGYVLSDSKGKNGVLTILLVFPLAILVVEYLALEHWGFAQRISVSVGALEAWLGMAALAVSQRRTAYILGCLWVAQAAYQVAFTLRLFVAYETWVAINNVLPWTVAVFAFSVISLRKPLTLN